MGERQEELAEALWKAEREAAEYRSNYPETWAEEPLKHIFRREAESALSWFRDRLDSDYLQEMVEDGVCVELPKHRGTCHRVAAKAIRDCRDFIAPTQPGAPEEAGDE